MPGAAGWRERSARACRQLAAASLCAALLFGAAQPGAWDATRMQAAANQLGPRAAAGAQALQRVLAGSAALDEAERLEAVNRFFNRRIAFHDDTEVWQRVDHWASPLETLDKGRGDCEDYAIGKYFALTAVGVPVAKLRLVYVRAQLNGGVQAHMVLAYYATPDAEPLILDNLVTEIRPASRRPDLAPVFSFNGEGLWQGVGAQSAGDPVARLSRWREVLAKASAEGFR